MSSDEIDKDVLQAAALLDAAKAQFMSVMRLTETCWDTCVSESRLRDKMDGKAETCVANCVDRFLDVQMTIIQRFQQQLQRSGGGSFE